MTLPLSQLIDSRYVITKLKAVGGMAEIYEANDTFYHRPVTIKILKETCLDKDTVEHFKNEINFASSFNNNHIYKVFNVGEYQNRMFMVIEQMKAVTLKEMLDERGHFAPSESINLLMQIIDAVKDMHSRDITHNDLKPDNAMVLHDGTVKLFDFGIATHIYDSKFERLLASAQYVAPEVVQNKCFTKQSDIYSLGIILFEFLTGKTPFMKSNTQDEIRAHILENIPSISTLIDIPNHDDFDLIIKKCTDKNLSKRYSSVIELECDLLKVKNGDKLKRGSIFTRLVK